MDRVLTRKIKMGKVDIQRLQEFADLPSWIIEAWDEEFGECNVPSLGLLIDLTIKPMLKQLPKQRRRG